MNLPRNVEYTTKIHHCIDELLMEDTTFNHQAKNQFSQNKTKHHQNKSKEKNIHNKSQQTHNNDLDFHNTNRNSQKAFLNQINSQFIDRKYSSPKKINNFTDKKHTKSPQFTNKHYKQILQKQQQLKKLTHLQTPNIIVQNNHPASSLYLQKPKKSVRNRKQQKEQTNNKQTFNQLSQILISQPFNTKPISRKQLYQKIQQKSTQIKNQQQISIKAIAQNKEPQKTVNFFQLNKNNLKLKKTFSYQVQDQKEREGQKKQVTESNTNSPKFLLPSTKNIVKEESQFLQHPFSEETQENQHDVRKKKSLSIREKVREIFHKKISRNKGPADQYKCQYQVRQEQENKQKRSSKKSDVFHLSHEELQFLSLLYPNESPEQLLMKLLSYYEDEEVYKNSFDQLFPTESIQKGSHFFATNHQIPFKNLKTNINDTGDDHTIILHKDKNFLQVSASNLEIIDQAQNQNQLQVKNSFSKLKQECLSALGQQIVQTQIKSSLAETVNVNYYTRQYAMPIIMDSIEQKNLESQYKLQKLIETIKANQEQNALKIEEITMTVNQQKIAAVLNQNPPENSNISHIPSQFVHKVYIPANSRGQSFETDYKPDPKLFEYITENQYRRILRDINHLIQKVLSYHRHNTFLKKKKGSLLKGWNLALLIFLFIIILMLYTRCFFTVQSSYLEIVMFFCLSLIVILILGNSFNNYKRSVKRSSVIKDICQQVTNYLDFVNSSNKNIKWILGKDFFWLQIWIDVIKNNRKK